MSAERGPGPQGMGSEKQNENSGMDGAIKAALRRLTHEARGGWAENKKVRVNVRPDVMIELEPGTEEEQLREMLGQKSNPGDFLEVEKGGRSVKIVKLSGEDSFETH